jgi:hypothetical protein
MPRPLKNPAEKLRRAGVKKAPANRRGGAGGQKPWTPSDQDWQVYHLFASGVRKLYIAQRIGIDNKTVHRIIKRMSDHLAVEFMDEIRRLRVEHTMRLSHIVEESMAAWRKSKRPGVTETVNQSGGDASPAAEPVATGQSDVSRVTKTVHQCGNAAYLSEARAAMAEIRKIWGADTKPMEIPDADAEGERVAGKSRQEALQAAAEKILSAITPSTN